MTLLLLLMAAKSFASKMMQYGLFEIELSSIYFDQLSGKKRLDVNLFA